MNLTRYPLFLIINDELYEDEKAYKERSAPYHKDRGTTMVKRGYTKETKKLHGESNQIRDPLHTLFRQSLRKAIS